MPYYFYQRHEIIPSYLMPTQTTKLKKVLSISLHVLMKIRMSIMLIRIEHTKQVSFGKGCMGYYRQKYSFYWNCYLVEENPNIRIYFVDKFSL